MNSLLSLTFINPQGCEAEKEQDEAAVDLNSVKPLMGLVAQVSSFAAQTILSHL